MSSKLIFYDLAQDGIKLQAVFNWTRVGGAQEEFHSFAMLTRIGDIVSQYSPYPETFQDEMPDA